VGLVASLEGSTAVPLDTGCNAALQLAGRNDSLGFVLFDRHFTEELDEYTRSAVQAAVCHGHAQRFTMRMVDVDVFLWTEEFVG